MPPWPSGFSTESKFDEKDPAATVDATVTVADALAVPAGPMQVSVYVVVSAGDTDWDPDVGCAPDHPPEARQNVASADVQLRVDARPRSMLAGDAMRLAVGDPTEAVTATVVVVRHV